MSRNNINKSNRKYLGTYDKKLIDDMIDKTNKKVPNKINHQNSYDKIANS
jgi:hypothetical protein